MIENVPEILNTRILIGGNWILIDDYLRHELGDTYYFNERKVVNAMYYGVAQSRERCVYLLAAKSTSIHWEFPEPSSTVTTMRDAIGDLPSLDPDVTDISDEERNAYFADVARAAKAIHKAFNPDKVNYGAYGDTGCHLHVHLVPKYKDGFEWGGVFEMNPGKTYLTDAEYAEMIEKIKACL
jgi:hypothetical protein